MMDEEKLALYSLDGFEPEIMDFSVPPDDWFEELKACAAEIFHVSNTDYKRLLKELTETYIEGTAIYWQRSPKDRRFLISWILEALVSNCIHKLHGDASEGEFQHVYLNVTDHIDVNTAPEIDSVTLEEIKKELTVVFSVLVTRLHSAQFQNWSHKDWWIYPWFNEQPPFHEMMLCNLFKSAFYDEPEKHMNGLLECISFDTIYSNLFYQHQIKGISWLKPFVKRRGKKKGIPYPVSTDPTSYAA